MSGEYTVLALYGILIILMIFLDTGLSIKQFGDEYMRSPRDEKRDKEGKAGRAERAVINCTIGMALFAPAILLLGAKDAFTGTTLATAWIYLISRIVYVVCYVQGIATVRTIAFVIGLLAVLFLFVLAL